MWASSWLFFIFPGKSVETAPNSSVHLAACMERPLQESLEPLTVPPINEGKLAIYCEGYLEKQHYVSVTLLPKLLTPVLLTSICIVSRYHPTHFPDISPLLHSVYKLGDFGYGHITFPQSSLWHVPIPNYWTVLMVHSQVSLVFHYSPEHCMWIHIPSLVHTFFIYLCTVNLLESSRFKSASSFLNTL